MMTWLLLATGFTGAFTLRFVYRQLVQLFVVPPAVEVRITHGADSMDGLLGALKRARREILVLARSFAARPVAMALVEAKLRGVKVEILLDPACERDRSSDLSFLLEQGLQPLAVAPNAISTGAVIIVDGRTIYCGGFSSPAELGEDTAVDLLCIKGYAEAVAAYRLHFSNEKSEARPAENKHQPAPGTTTRLPPAPTPTSTPGPQRLPASTTLPAAAPSPPAPAPASTPGPQRLPASTTLPAAASSPSVAPLPAPLTPSAPASPAATTPSEPPVRKVA